MATPKSHRSNNRRLKLGATILEAAAVADTRIIANRFENFAATHRRFVEAQSAVDAMQRRVDVANEQIAADEAIHDQAFEQLLIALLTDGKPRTNPIAEYGVNAPARLLTKTTAFKLAAVAALVPAVLADGAVSAKTREKAEALRAAAQVLAPQLDGLTSLEAELQRLRGLRDAVAEEWDQALRALRRGARIAADEGATHLYEILFGADEATHQRKTSEATPEAPASDDKAAA